MKRLFYLYTLLILAGCTDMSVNDIYEGVNEEFQAFIEDNSSRTYIDGQIRMRWTAEDRVTLFRKNTYNREYMFTGKTGANAGGFRQVSTDDDFWFGYDVNANYAIYPHSADTELDETELCITYNMPSEQTYVENSFGLGANVMVAVADNSQLMFKNVGSYLRVRLYGESVSVSSITLTSKGGEAIAGKAKITPTMNGDPTCEMIGNGQSVRLVCPTQVTISSDANNPTDFWIVVPPVTFSKGFSVTVENSDGDTQVFDVDKSVTFKRNSYNNLSREVTIKNMPTYHVATAGTLSNLIPDEEKTSITEMKVTVYLNGKDITILCRMAGNPIVFDKVSFKVGSLKKLNLSEATFVKDGSYYHYGLNSNVIEKGVIGEGMFLHCDSLERIILPNDTEIIDKDAFKYCRSLTSIVLPDGIKTIGEYAFSETSLESIKLPESLQTIGSGAFMWCKKLVSIAIPSNVTSIGEYAFHQCNLNSVDIYGVCSIGNSAFDMSNITTLNIHNGLKSIGTFAFSSCKFTSLVIPGFLEKIGDYAFYQCYNLEHISIDGVKHIGDYAFTSCKARVLVIPEQVESIGECAFSSDYIKEVHCKATIPPSISNNSFGSYDYESKIFYVPKGSLELYKSTEGWKLFQTIREELI